MTSTVTQQPFAGGQEHLKAELQWLNLLLLREVVRFRVTRQAPPDGFQGLYIGDAEVDRLLAAALGWSPETAAAQAPLLEEIARQAEAQRAAVDARLAATGAGGNVLPLERLGALFGLTPFDRAALIAGCAPDLDGRYETIYAYLQDDVTRRRPAVGLVLSLLCSEEEGWSARRRFAPDAPLLARGLLRVAEEQPFLSRTLRVDDRVLDFLLELPGRVDARLRPFVSLVSRTRSEADSGHLGPELQRRLEGLAALWCREAPAYRPVALLEGGYGAGADEAAYALAVSLGRPVLEVAIGTLLTIAAWPEELTELVRREALLHDALLVLRDAHLLGEEQQRATEALCALDPLLQEPPFPVAALCTAPLEGHRLPPGLHALRLPFPPPDYEQRRSLWAAVLAREGVDATLCDVERVADTFILSPGQIADAGVAARHRVTLRGDNRATLDDLRAAARARCHHGLTALARTIEPLYAWGDIVLPGATLRQLGEITAAMLHRHRVLDEWGFGGRLPRGKGLAVLFSGPSGTGKTMAAEVIARELGLDLYAIDLATVVSKYIGETEKNLRRIFQEAQTSNAALFFDEADALFGRRATDIKNAHDRYINMEVAYLLQLMEAYEGLAILATNLSQNVDEAFTRRMQYVVEFPFPDEGLRARIWKGIFPPATPLAEDVDIAFLARRFDIAGGTIKNAALAAAVLAAADGGRVTMPHLALAVAREYQKLGRLPSQGEFGPYYG
ncbi:MAG: ATP-binding protein, partial [Dehalococcoidia bacterium]